MEEKKLAKLDSRSSTRTSKVTRGKWPGKRRREDSSDSEEVTLFELKSFNCGKIRNGETNGRNADLSRANGLHRMTSPVFQKSSIKVQCQIVERPTKSAERLTEAAGDLQDS